DSSSPPLNRGRRSWRLPPVIFFTLTEQLSSCVSSAACRKASRRSRRSFPRDASLSEGSHTRPRLLWRAKTLHEPVHTLAKAPECKPLDIPQGALTLQPGLVEPVTAAGIERQLTRNAKMPEPLQPSSNELRRS